MARAIDIQPIIEKIQFSLEIPSYSEHDKGFDDGLKYVLDLIEKTPTLTPPNEWVSVEDALPERGKLVIVCVGGEVTVDTRLMSKTGIIGDWAIHQSRADSITHWMHLPESPYSRPPEGEEDT